MTAARRTGQRRNTTTAIEDAIEHELAGMREHWRWFVFLGGAMVVVGLFAMTSAFVATLASVVLFGAVLMLAGIGEMVAAFWAGRWGGFLLHLLVGILYLVVGFIIIDSPVGAAATLTLVLALFFLAAGIFRIASALVMRFPDWGWVMMSGIVSVLLGLFIYKQWPAAALYVIGLFIGIELMFNGWSWVMLGLGLKRLPEDE